MKVCGLLLILAIAAGGFLSGCRFNEGANEGTVNGGTCTYETFAGILTVKEVRPNPESGEESIVFFIYRADSEKAPPLLKSFYGSIRLSKKEMLQKNISPNQSISTPVKYIVNGTCTPGPDMLEFNQFARHESSK